MSDQKVNILDLTEKSRLSADITLLMLRGAGYAAVFLLACWAVIAILALIGGALPPESQQAPDPSPWSYVIEAPVETVKV